MTDGKTCTKCKVFKSFGEFHRDKKRKDGFQFHCKSCVKEYQVANADRKKMYDKRYYVANADKRKLHRKKYYEENRVEENADRKTCTKCKVFKSFGEFHRDKYTKDGFRYLCKSCMKEYQVANSDKLNLQKMEYYQKNKVEIRTQQNKYMRTKRQTDEAFKLLLNLRRRLHHALNGTQKSKSTKELTGMELNDLLKYLYEKSPRFEGVPLSELHVDHIIPCAAFDMGNVDHQRVCFHYTNLQLLTPAENLSKRDSVPPGFDVDDYVKKHLPRGNSSFSSAILPLP